MPDTLRTVVYVLLGTAAYVVWWFIVLRIIWRFGWRALEQSYPLPYPVTGPRFGNCTLLVPPAGRYNRCIVATIAREGIQILPVGLFRPGHRPALIPWEAVQSVQRGASPAAGLTLRFPAGKHEAYLILPSQAMEEVARWTDPGDYRA